MLYIHNCFHEKVCQLTLKFPFLVFLYLLGAFASLMKLPANEKAIAFKMMKEGGVPMLPSIPVTQAQLAMKVFNRLRRGVEVTIKSSSIGI